MSDFSFPSGDLSEDELIAEQFKLRMERMNNNVCPNRCAAMNWLSAYNRECPKCGFQGFSTKPYDIKTGNA
jgi:hypothetical protein